MANRDESEWIMVRTYTELFYSDENHRYATGTSARLLLPGKLRFQVHNFCVNLHGFTIRKMLHISQDVICLQSWSKNYSKYALVRRIYTFTTVEPDVLVRVGQFAYSKLQSLLAIVAGYPAIGKC